MIKAYIILFLIIISGCSLKTPENEWQYKSSHAFSNYTKDFLMGNDILAQNDLDRAIKYSKKSGNLTQLARVYLGECALNISVGIDDDCKKYTYISDLVNDNLLNAYYNFISASIKKQQIKYLPKDYHSFADNLLKKDFKSANKDIFYMQKVTSSFLSASLIRENIDRSSKEKILKQASYHGYKALVLFWLHESIKNNNNQKDIKKLKKKISILQSND